MSISRKLKLAILDVALYASILDADADSTYPTQTKDLDAAVERLLNVVSLRTEDHWQLAYPNYNRYCFHCKAARKFTHCDNCDKYFCTHHAKKDYDDFKCRSIEVAVCYHCRIDN